MNEAPKIGLSNVVIAKVLSDDDNGITYGPVKALKGAVNATVNPNSSVETDYADDGAFFATGSRGNTELALEMIDVDPDTLAEMLGQQKSNGVTAETAMDQAPYFAMGFKVWIAGTDANGDNRYEYRWYSKGKFSVPESGGTTKKETIEFGHTNMTAQFVSPQFVPSGAKAGIIGTHCRTDDPTVPESVKANWFNAPVTSLTLDDSELTVTAALSTGKVVITGSKESGASFTFAQGTAIVGETIVVTDASGEFVKGTLEFSDAGTAPTITFTPGAEEETPAGVTVTSGLKDSFGVGATPMTDTSL